MNKLIEKLVIEIQNWDMECVKELKDMIKLLKREIASLEDGSKIEDHLRIASLKSALYTNADLIVWAVDNKGFALTGESMDQIDLVKDL
jgi:hypothetical protein